MLAAELGMTRAEVRRRELHQSSSRITTAIGLIYDSGDYAKTLDGCSSCPTTRRRSSGGGRRRPRAASCSAAASPPTSRCAGSAPSAVDRNAIGLTPGGWETLHRADAPDRQGHGHHRHLAARPGSRDLVVADRRDRARRAVRRRRGDPRRHGVRALRARHVRQPQLAVGGTAVYRAAEQGPREGPAGGGPHARGVARRPRVRGRRVRGQGQPGQAHRASRRSPSAPGRAFGMPEGVRARPGRDGLPSTRPTSRSRSARTAARSRSIARPARSRSRATSPSTTAAT